jgi:hypothetical protein
MIQKLPENELSVVSPLASKIAGAIVGGVLVLAQGLAVDAKLLDKSWKLSPNPPSAVFAGAVSGMCTGMSMYWLSGVLMRRRKEDRLPLPFSTPPLPPSIPVSHSRVEEEVAPSASPRGWDLDQVPTYKPQGDQQAGSWVDDFQTLEARAAELEEEEDIWGNAR